MMCNIQAVLLPLVQMANARTYATHARRRAPKTATLGNGEFPKPQRA